MAERRTDPTDGCAYTFAELSSFYAVKYNKKAIAAYWANECRPVKPAKKKPPCEPRASVKPDSTPMKSDSRPVFQALRTLVFKHVFTRENPGRLDDFYEMDREKWGEGAFGQVTKGVDKKSGQERAVKVVDMSQIADKKRFEEEINIQQELNHPNIIRLREVFRDAQATYLVMELCTGGELFDWIEAAEYFDEGDAAKYMRQLLGAVYYLHTAHFVHRDIKPENILLLSEDENAPLKLIDFGAARRYEPGSGTKMMTRVGTMDYLAPQVLLGAGYSEKCDVWACGVLTYFMLSGSMPFSAGTEGELARKIRAGTFEFPSSDFAGVGDAARDIISQMMSMDESDRPSAETVLHHRWLDEKAPKQKRTIANDLGARLKAFKASTRLKRVALTVIAQQLKDEDLEELKRTFEELDADGNGTLSPAEIRQGMEKHSVAIPPDLDDLMRSCDSDNSGGIDYTEFVAATLTAQQYRRKSVMWSAFRTFDTDGDGMITKGDLASLLKESEDSSTVQAVFNQEPFENDGRISFDTFCEVMGKELSSKAEGSLSVAPDLAFAAEKS